MTKTPRRNPRWRDLSWKDKAAEAAQQLMESEADAYSFTLKLGATRIAKGRAAAKPFVTHVRDTMRHHLSERLGRVPPFWFVVEDLGRDGNGVEVHLHGVIAIEPGEKPAMKQALLEVAGRDTDRARALRLQSHYEPKVWVRYCFKNLHRGDPECTGFAMEESLRQAAGHAHDARRRARLRAARSHDHAGDSVSAPPVPAHTASAPHSPTPHSSVSAGPAPGAGDGEASEITEADASADESRPLDMFLDLLDRLDIDPAEFAADSEPVGIPDFLNEHIRLANNSLTDRLLRAWESAARETADAIGAQIEALGDEDDPGLAAYREGLERDRRAALMRADRILDERQALVCGRRSPDDVDMGALCGSRGAYSPAT